MRGPQPERQILPIPDRQHVGPRYDAKDPATSFPPIEPLRPPEGAPTASPSVGGTDGAVGQDEPTTPMEATPVSWSTPTTTPAGCSTPSQTSRSWTARWCT